MASPPSRGRGGATPGSSVDAPRVYGISDDFTIPPDARTLRLRVLSGSDLMKKDIFGASDPYVRMDLINAEDGSQADTAW